MPKKLPNMDERTHDRLQEVAKQRAAMIKRYGRMERLVGMLIGVAIAVLLALLANLVGAVAQ